MRILNGNYSCKASDTWRPQADISSRAHPSGTLSFIRDFGISGQYQIFGSSNGGSVSGRASEYSWLR
jgi:hypothetical protein